MGWVSHWKLWIWLASPNVVMCQYLTKYGIVVGNELEWGDIHRRKPARKLFNKRGKMNRTLANAEQTEGWRNTRDIPDMSKKKYSAIVKS